MPIKTLRKALPERSYQMLKSTGALKLNDTMARISQHFGDNLPPEISNDELMIPDTKITKQATELTESLIKPSIVNHSIRMYLFGLCLAKHQGSLKEIDREQFYLSSILSKIGLSDDIRDLDEYKGRDFELIGADYSHKFLSSKDVKYDQFKCNDIHEQIALHTSVGTVDLMQPQFSFLYAGYALDLLGNQKYNVRQEVIREILNKYPRTTFANDMKILMERETVEKPYSAVASDIVELPLLSLNPLDEKQGYPL